jgi:hypothetical protein
MRDRGMCDRPTLGGPAVGGVIGNQVKTTH